jgi:hypothetical protein
MSRQWGRPAGWLLFGTAVTMLLSGTGCAAMLIGHTGTEKTEIYLPKQRAEIRERFGQAEKTETFPDGFSLDTYHLRKKVITESVSLGGSGRGNVDGLFLWLGLNLMTYGAPEVLAAGVVLEESIRNGYHVAFVYDQEGQIVLRYLLNDPPAKRFGEVQRQLAQRVWDDLQEDAPPLAPRIDLYGTNLRRWAQYVEYPLPPEAEEALQFALQLARDADEGRLSREEVLLWLRSPSAYNPLAC